MVDPDGHVVLVGMMGAGKSTVGRVLATRLNRPFYDSDAMVEARTGRTVATIFAEQGEAAFRAEEAAALADALASVTPAVVAAAGGTVLDPRNRRLLADAGLVVWLRAEPAVLAARVHPGDHRPLLAHDAEASLRRLAAERQPFYAEVSDLIVDVDRATVDAAVVAIADALTDAVATDQACR
jgi:shikimate kinase